MRNKYVWLGEHIVVNEGPRKVFIGAGRDGLVTCGPDGVLVPLFGTPQADEILAALNSEALASQAADKERIAVLEAALRIIADGIHDGPNSFRHVARYALGSGGDEKGDTMEEHVRRVSSDLLPTPEHKSSAKDLAAITDPDEFEKAWKRVFGKRRQ